MAVLEQQLLRERLRDNYSPEALNQFVEDNLDDLLPLFDSDEPEGDSIVSGGSTGWLWITRENGVIKHSKELDRLGAILYIVPVLDSLLRDYPEFEVTNACNGYENAPRPGTVERVAEALLGGSPCKASRKQ